MTTDRHGSEKLNALATNEAQGIRFAELLVSPDEPSLGIPVVESETVLAPENAPLVSNP